DRQHDLVVYIQKPQLAWLDLVIGHDVAGKIDVAVIWVRVLPVPLMSGHLDGEVGVGRAILVINQPDRWEEDNDQNHDGDHGPGDLERTVMASPAWDRVGA